MIGNGHDGITEEQLGAIGKAWTKKQGETRWYVNGWMDLIGMDVTYYNTGNVADVRWTRDGEETNPSNNWFKKYVARTKVWVDAEGRVHVDYCESKCVEEAIVGALDRLIESMVAPAEEEAETEYWLDVESDGADSFGLFAGAVSTLGPYASEDEARARAQVYGGKWKVWSRVSDGSSVTTRVCAESQGAVGEVA